MLLCSERGRACAYLLPAVMLFLAFPSIAHGQIRPLEACDPQINQPATISSITPGTWIAGQQVQVTIIGNFPGGDQPGCEMNEDGIVNSAGDLDTLATIKTDPGGCGCYASGTFSPTQVTITVKVAANHPPGLVYLDLSCDGCGQSVTGGPIQIVARGPTITSISPAAWFAGQSTDITITGAGFLTATDPGGPTELRITEPSGNIAVSNVAVVSATEITTTVAPGKNSPAGLATVKVINHPPGESPRSGTATQPVLPIPEIYWHSKKISGENAKTQSIKVGQPVELTTAPTSLPAGFTLGPVSWTVGGTNVGWVDASSEGIALTPTVLNTPNTTIYWLYPDTGLDVVYNYCAQDPSGNQYCSPTATATFDAREPLSSLSTWDSDEATVEHLESCDAEGKFTNERSPYLGYGDLSGPAPGCPGLQNGTPGIKLTASPASGGKYIFVQLIDSDSRTYTSSVGAFTCTTAPNLDKQYPYPPYKDIPNVAPDGPQMPLPVSDISGERNFLATMYLLWQPDQLRSTTTPSIPVPIGHQQWHFRATTLRVQTVGVGRWKKPMLIGHGDTGEYVASQPTDNELYGYPVFTAPATEVCPK